MHSSRTRTACTLPYGGVSVRGGLPGQRPPPPGQRLLLDSDPLDRDPRGPPPPVDRLTPVKKTFQTSFAGDNKERGLRLESLTFKVHPPTDQPSLLQMNRATIRTCSLANLAFPSTHVHDPRPSSVISLSVNLPNV